MDYANLNDSIKSIISYNINLDNLTNYIDPPSYIKEVTLEYISKEYKEFEKWFLDYIQKNPITKDIAVLNFNIISNNTNFLINILTYRKFNKESLEWSKEPISNYSNPETANLLDKLKPNSSDANIAFISTAIIISFINTFAMTHKNDLIKDRSILFIYPPLRITINFEQEEIHLVRTI